MISAAEKKLSRGEERRERVREMTARRPVDSSESIIRLTRRVFTRGD